MMTTKCEHRAAQVLYDYPEVIIYRCDGCSKILIGNEMGLNAIDDSDHTELAALRERVAALENDLNRIVEQERWLDAAAEGGE